MNILIAPDKFKGSLSAQDVCAAISSGLLAIDPSLNIRSLPLADGGEGTCEILVKGSHGTRKTAQVLDPLFRETEASFGISGDGKTAFVEMASASGLQLLQPGERNPELTTTLGTGQLVAEALNQGVSKLVLGIGGSATHDAGLGMAAALGFRFLDQTGHSFVPVGRTLHRWEGLDSNHVNPGLARTLFTILCDVNNPLFGPDGAAYVFGPQKGARPESLALLDDGLRHFASKAKQLLHQDADFPGAGAGGGIASGAKIFLHAEVKRGFDFISDYLKLEDAMQQADLVITGEGQIDQQSLSGKVVGGVARLAQQHDKPCMAITGQVDLAEEKLDALSLRQIVRLVGPDVTADDAIRNAASLLAEETTKALSHWIKARG